MSDFDCECGGQDFKKISEIARFLNRYASLLQAVAAVIGLLVIYYAIQSFKIEYNKFNLDYGDQVSLTLSGAQLIAKSNNNLVTDMRVTTNVFLQISDNEWLRENPQYIELRNFFVCPGAISYFSYNNNCNFTDKTFQVPAWRVFSLGEQTSSLKIIFQNSPYKNSTFVSLIYISKIEYTDPKGQYRKEYYYSEIRPEAFISYPVFFPPEDTIYSRHFRLTEEQLETSFDKGKIIYSVNYSDLRPLGLAEYKFTSRMLIALSKYRWHKRFIEPSSLRYFRTIKSYAGGDLRIWRDFLAKENFLEY